MVYKIITSRRQGHVFAHNSTKKSRRSTKSGRKVVRATGDIPHQFLGQNRSKSPRRIMLIRVKRHISILVGEGLLTSNLIICHAYATQIPASLTCAMKKKHFIKPHHSITHKNKKLSYRWQTALRGLSQSQSKSPNMVPWYLLRMW